MLSHEEVEQLLETGALGGVFCGTPLAFSERAFEL
jgi:hypothetical protein